MNVRRERPAMVESVRAIWNMKYCPLHMPWFSHHPDTVLLRQIELIQARAYRRQRGEHIRLFVDPWFWPVVTLIQAVRWAGGSVGGRVRAVDGVSRLRQIWQQVYVANRYNMRNEWYYRLGVWRYNTGEAANYAFEPLFPGLLEYLDQTADRTVLHDKVEFWKHCVEYGLATVPVLAVCSRARGVIWYGSQSLPQRDIFVKPRDAYGGHGAESWTWDGQRWCRKGRCCTEEELLESCTQGAGGHDVILSPRVLNHAEMEQLSTGALVTLRIVTIAQRGETPEVLLAVLRIPVATMEVDNFGAGGLAAPVDSEGRLGAAVFKDFLTKPPRDTHPDTGARIAGAVVRSYPAMVRLCIEAHRTLPQFATIGWDVALSSEGPVLVEANTNWCVLLAQLPGSQPLYATRFSDFARAMVKEHSGS